MLKNYKNIFIIGIKGVAMANLARILHQMGKHVSGSDTSEEFITDKVLTESNIQLIHSFEATQLPHTVDLVIYSAAHGGINNPQAQEAKKRGIKIMHQVEVLGEILQQFQTSIAVCGCHGKTTTSALLSYTLKKLHAEPSYMVGVSDFNGNWGGEYTGKSTFVVEADEYGINPPHDKTPKINYLEPTHAICMNIDYDHPDVYDSLEQTKKTFLSFFQKVLMKGQLSSSLIFCADDDNLMSVADFLPKSSYRTYGFSSSADFIISSLQSTEEYSTFTLSYNGATSEYRTSVFGEKNISNVVGVIAMLTQLGYSPQVIQESIQGFTGAKRRFEQILFKNNTYIFDDYAHHPHEIEATINAARLRFPNRRLLVLFQPHTFSRTESLKQEFILSLTKADMSFVLPIFGSARETVTENAITSDDLQKLAQQQGMQNVFGFTSKESILEKLQSIIQSGDVIFTMGAGDVYKMANKIEEMI